MNSATRVLDELSKYTDGTSEHASVRLLAAVSANAMGETDDPVRPFTSWLNFLEATLPGSVAIGRVRATIGSYLDREARS